MKNLTITTFLFLFFCIAGYSQYGLNDDLDGDGIINSLDYDDDNDGIRDPVECNLVEGEFAGTFGSSSTPLVRDLQIPLTAGYHYYPGTYGGEGAYAVINGLNNHWQDANHYWDNQRGHTTGTDEDAFLAVNGSIGVGIFYAQKVFLAPNTPYKIGLWALNANSSPAEAPLYPVNLGMRLKDYTGAVVATATTGDIVTSQKWTEAVVYYTTGPTNLSYTFEVFNLSTGAAGNDFSIDDVFFEGCPDTDGDGIKDFQDLDSDNDGCPDALENDGGYKWSDLTPNGALKVDVNRDPTSKDYGIPLSAKNGLLPGTSKDPSKVAPECDPCNSTSTIFVDTDKDGVGDDCDVDDDNDGIPDNVECIKVTGEYEGTFGLAPSNSETYTRDLQVPLTGNYTYQPITTVPPTPTNAGAGKYAVVSGYSVGIWHGGFAGNLGHTNGTKSDLFLAINGSANVGIYYTQQVYLQAGSTYDFGYWAKNANKDPGYPCELGANITFNGTVLKTISSGVLESGPNIIWNNVKGTFSPTQSGLYTLNVFNISQNGGAGNDFLMDDVYFNRVGGCIDTDGDGIADYLDLDSDGDGCPDALESTNTTYKWEDLNPNGSINVILFPVGTTPKTDTYGLPNSKSYGVGSSEDKTNNACQCYKPGSGTAVNSKVGISTLNRQLNNATTQWPENVHSGYLVLDSQQKGFVINRLTTDEINAIANKVSGMMVYDVTVDCVKIYDENGWNCIEQTCVDLIK